jgi:hypothetical protein
MGSAAERLLGLLDAPDRYDIPLRELRATQLDAANEIFQDRVERIRLLANRAETGRIRAIRDFADLVPLLFAHTSYKSYPENWLTEGKWDRLGRWLDTVSTNRVQGVDTNGVRDVDDWLERLAAKGHFVSCSSGTTGKISMINAAAEDRTINKKLVAKTYEWPTGIRPNNDYNIFTLNPSSNNFRNSDTTDGMAEVYGAPNEDHRFRARVTIGEVSRMVGLRKSVAEGTALPSSIADYEKLVAERQQLLDDAVIQAAEGLISTRGQKALIIGQFPLVHRVAETIRGMGSGGERFHAENSLLVAGGLKGATLPADYREFIMQTLNIKPRNLYHFYAMQEVNTHFPRCEAGRYHVAPWLLLLPLDAPGEQLLEPQAGEIEGRAGFFDLSIHGRWGGVISGDRIRVDYGKCACGHEGPTIDRDIIRYKDLPGGDYITCAGTIDAYVRGVA